MDVEDAAVIVLAAGEGTRAGGTKGLIDVGGVPWIARQLAALGQAGVREAVVVVGRAKDAYLARLAWMAAALADRAPVGDVVVRAVVNDRPELGPFSSLALGLARVVGAAFVLPVDVPCPSPATWRALASALGDADAAVPTFDGRGGHPVLLSDRFAATLRALPPTDADARLDTQLRARGDAVVRVPIVDSRVRQNLTTKEDFERLAPS